MDILTGVGDLFGAYQNLIAINPGQNPEFLIRHLSKLFDEESNTADDATQKQKQPEFQTIEKIRKVYQVYKTLLKWDPQEAPKILIQNLQEILEMAQEQTRAVTNEYENEDVPPVVHSESETGGGGEESFSGYNFTPSSSPSCLQESEGEELDTDSDDSIIILSPPPCHDDETEEISILSPVPAPVSIPVPVPMSTQDETEESEEGSLLKRKFREQLHFHSNLKNSRPKTRKNRGTKKKKKKTKVVSRNYICDYCHNMFLSPSHLAIHIRVHTKEKPYFCGICQAAFSQISSRNLHMKVHSRPFSCGFCTWTFNTLESRAAHEKSNHGVTTIAN